jgi:hypothetical protein
MWALQVATNELERDARARMRRREKGRHPRGELGVEEEKQSPPGSGGTRLTAAA